MKILICSDIHGDLDSMERVLEAYKSENADKLLILGDLLYHGPRNDLPSTYAPKKVIELLNENKENILKLVSSAEESTDLQVHIGSENALDAMSNSSFVYRLVRRNGQVVGAVGVIGPRRMDYSRVIALLNQLSLGISGLIGSDEAGGGALSDGKK